eukprot:6457376-Amphidinium_carterae.1
MDCLTEVLSSSDDDDSTWESLEPSKCPQGFVERGFASKEEEEEEEEAWNFYLKVAKHMEEFDDAASQPRWTSRAKLSWRKTKSGRRRATSACFQKTPSCHTNQ